MDWTGLLHLYTFIYLFFNDCDEIWENRREIGEYIPKYWKIDFEIINDSQYFFISLEYIWSSIYYQGIWARK